jgi:hypothetical protein
MATPGQPDERPKQSMTLAELFRWLTGNEPTPEELGEMREAAERINARLRGDDPQPETQ